VSDDGDITKVFPGRHATRVATLKHSAAQTDCYPVNTGRQFGRPVR
jgi:hypothetical protein